MVDVYYRQMYGILISPDAGGNLLSPDVRDIKYRQMLAIINEKIEKIARRLVGEIDFKPLLEKGHFYRQLYARIGDGQ